MLLSAALSLSSLSLFYLTSDSEIFFNYHPSFMILGYLFFMSQGLLTVVNFKGARSYYLNLHLIFGLLAQLASSYAFYVIYTNKIISNRLHFQTWHSWFGLVTFCLTTNQNLFGLVHYFCSKQLISKLGFPLYRKTILLHGLAGQFAYLLAAVTYVSGFRSNWAERNFPIYVNYFFISLVVVLPLAVLWKINWKH
eukprot:TRINITY_DN7343_c0_g1_i1.p1 TRINITY_DN7343_c0_g1~~TRINITY_DN7343_c0_g1_i1.p1  ORF type:complete len:216 (-),score=30.15 TRINITY_DN7343_c0_g1_i1:4-588(-)